MAAPTFYNLIIYSNDGTTVLSSYSDAAQTITVTDTGCTGYTYSGSKKFLGFATSPNATTPIYAIGDTFSFSADTELYIVEEEVALAATITYNGNVIASLEAGKTATLPCKGKKMKSDIVVTAPAESGGTDTRDYRYVLMRIFTSGTTFDNVAVKKIYSNGADIINYSGMGQYWFTVKVGQKISINAVAKADAETFYIKSDALGINHTVSGTYTDPVTITDDVTDLEIYAYKYVPQGGGAN